MLTFALSELSIIVYAIASTAKSSTLARFGVGFHGLFCSLILFLHGSTYVALASLLVGAIAVPLVLSKTSSRSCIGLSSSRAALSVIVIATIPLVALAGGLNDWPIQICIQSLLALSTLRCFGHAREIVIAISGLGHLSTILSALLPVFPIQVPLAIEISTLFASVAIVWVESPVTRQVIV